ncbi:PD-(D/E)XK nuclease domain-containing protein [Adhaeribacter rhizoryzae]|uniref:Uncharacterized protein n=1 Tax=Adhaeribacter rhizoryzae TaxID=2607907 RepID=A0A5M6CUX1_9BACT|nr:PD-(D/E)XK nuclease domain-containing protein [Adhaeribacter rhizoryzae]KAA5539047.1 hypothetical protein F0145_25250 [Adhaeribacter rhizoryzae]
MEYGPYYSIYELARAAEKILALIDKFQITFFTDRNIPYDRKEILCSIQIGKSIKSIDGKVPMTSHPAIYSAMKGIEFYEKKEVENDTSANEMMSHVLYIDLVWLTNSMINLISNEYEREIEVKIQDKKYSEAIKLLTIEKQKDSYNNTHPQKFIERYKEYLDKRIKDLKELIELDKLDFGIELKEIIESYKLGLEVNVKGRNFLTPLLQRNYELLTENLKNALFIPSYHDISKDEKEKYYHVYLLGILEGRLNLYNLKSNKESGFGRYDICAFPINKNHPGLLIEIKSDNTNVSTALTQIKLNNYVNELRVEGVKEVLILAINFQPKDIIIDYETIHLE